MAKITEIRSDKNKKNRVIVFIDDKPAISLDTRTVLLEKISVDKEINETQLKEIEKRERVRHCYEVALRYLRYRPCSEKELSGKLKKQKFAEIEIIEALKKLKEQGLVDDNAFANFWVENRETFKPGSRYLIARELRTKGISEDIISSSVSSLNDEDNAYRAGIERARRLKTSDYQVFRQRLGNYLRRRGFSYEIIERTVTKIWQETEKNNISGAPALIKHNNKKDNEEVNIP